jgi:hypothetical protein
MILVAGWKWCLQFNVEDFHTQEPNEADEGGV